MPGTPDGIPLTKPSLGTVGNEQIGGELSVQPVGAIEPSRMEVASNTDLNRRVGEWSATTLRVFDEVPQLNHFKGGQG